MRILIAEDNNALREGLCDLLAGDGHDCHPAADGLTARALFDAAPFPVVILDVVMPGMDGLSLCRHIRSTAPHSQILILSARGECFDRALGLELGADDYVAKPFDPAELRARIKGMARRAGGPPIGETQFQMDDLRIDPLRLTARRSGEDNIPLNPRELAVLRLLYRHAGIPVSRNTLFDECWGRDYFPNSRALDQYISALRQRIERQPRQPRIIETVRGVGYRYPR